MKNIPYVPSVGWEKWLYSRIVVQYPCPRCGAQPGFYCETPTGRKAWPPHVVRGLELTQEDIDACRVAPGVYII